MPTPYEEISEHYSNVESVKTDANLAQDTLQLGGIDAEDWATKKYVRQVDTNNSIRDQAYADAKAKEALDAAKAYSDAGIRNIDFTPFATNASLNVVRDNLQQQINTNKHDIDELFQSVSNGKSKIAGAITDKGVPTSASATFQIMANNIRQIPTSGETDTSDATASAEHVLAGYSAYARGQKINGTLVPTTETGAIIPPIIIGTETYDADILPSDVSYGKIAYSNGQRIVGTATDESNDVEEIYGLANENYDNTSIEGYTNVIYSDEPNKKSVATGKFDVSYDGTYIVQAVNLYENDVFEGRYIESKRMNDERVIGNVTDQHGTKYKFRYSFEELGLDPEADISYIKFGMPGYKGSMANGLLLIIQDTKVHIYLFNYILNSNIEPGRIGIQYSSDIEWHWETELPRVVACKPAASNTNPTQFGIVLGLPNSNPNTDYNIVFLKFDEILKEIILKITNTFGKFYYVYICRFSNNDNYFYANGFWGGVDLLSICRVNKAGNYEAEGNLYVKTSGIMNNAYILPNETEIIINGEKKQLNYNNGNIDIVGESGTRFFDEEVSHCGMSLDGKNFYTAGGNIKIFEVDWDSETAWTPKEIITGFPTDNFEFSKDMGFATGGDTNNLRRLRKNYSAEIIGVKYKGEYFYKGGEINE